MKKYLLALLVVNYLALLHADAQSIFPQRILPVIPPSERTDIVGILGAFPEEVKLLLANVENKTEYVVQHITFTTGRLKGQKVVVAQTGIGKVNAAMTTILLIEHFHPQRILFTGIAGAINPTLLPGDLVIGTRVAHHDYGTATDSGTQRRATRNPSTLMENPVYFESDTFLIRVAQIAARDIVLEKVEGAAGPRTPSVTSGIIVTGDVFVSSAAFTSELRIKMGADATEMEGAAVAQVSYQQSVPFLVVRSMSDTAGKNAYADMKNFYQIAARNSAALTMAIVERCARLEDKGGN